MVYQAGHDQDRLQRRRGVNVEDLEVATVPVTRFQVRSGRSLGGITVRLFEQDTQSVMIRFFDQDGIDIAEPGQRKIERLYHREEFRRALASEIGDIGYAPRALELYTAALSDTVDVDAIARAGFKMVLDYSFGTASFVMPNVLAKLGAEVLVVNPYAATAAGLHGQRPPGRGRTRGGPGTGLRGPPGRRDRPGRREHHPGGRRGQGLLGQSDPPPAP